MTTEHTEQISEEKKKRRKGRKKSKTIAFDDELVTKDAAEKILANVAIEEKSQSESKLKKGRKRNKNKVKNEIEQSNNHDENVDEISVSEPMKVDEETPVKKKKKRNQIKPVENGEADSSTPSDKKTESIRSIKRKRYAKLLEDKKIQTELQLQQKALNYLSKWKHSRNEWKFEKLRQIWILSNMFDESKIPNEFWDTIVEYFSNSKGKSRDSLLTEALKIIEDNENEKESTEVSVKIQRARDIIQSLQE